MSRRRKKKPMFARSARTTADRRSSGRRLHFEALEPRRLLATFAVANFLDGPVTGLGDLPGSLRQAVFDANAAPGADLILFDTSGPGEILLSAGEIEITEALRIVGPGFASFQINAQDNSRGFNFTATAGDFTIESIMLTGGRTTADNGLFDSSQSGGAIRSLTSGTLTIADSVVTGNRTQGRFAEGGAVFASGDVQLYGATISENLTLGHAARGGGVFTKGALTVLSSTISDNITSDDDAVGGGAAALGNITIANSFIRDNTTSSSEAHGGGLFSTGIITVSDSRISGNSTSGNRAAGGGLFTNGDVSLTRSTISGNQTRAEIEFVYRNLPYDNAGGGVRAGGNIVVDDSTISGNTTSGVAASGGGLFALGDVELRNSTVSGNCVVSPGKVLYYFGSGFQGRYIDYAANGGGVFARGSLTISNSTVLENSINDYGGSGGGVAVYGPITLTNSIIAGNTVILADPRIQGPFSPAFKTEYPDVRAFGGQLLASYSLIGDHRGTSLDPANPGTSLLDVDPQLNSLADNGGPTLTHAPQVNSRVIDAGDPNFTAPPVFDQRGDSFVRVAGGRIDIGAVEAPAGTGSSGAEFIVVDLDADSRFVYSEEGVLLDMGALGAGNNAPRGVATAPDGSQYWVVDTDGGVYVYNNAGALTSQWETSGLTNPQGIATDGTDIWIVSNDSDEIFRFTGGASFSGGVHAANSMFSLVSQNTSPFGLATDGASLWVVNDADSQWKVFKYTASGSLLGSWELDEDNKNARGITLDPDDLDDILVVNDAGVDRVFRYTDAAGVLSGSLTSSERYELNAANGAPHGLGGRLASPASLVTPDAERDEAGVATAAMESSGPVPPPVGSSRMGLERRTVFDTAFVSDSSVETIRSRQALLLITIAQQEDEIEPITAAWSDEELRNTEQDIDTAFAELGAGAHLREF